MKILRRKPKVRPKKTASRNHALAGSTPRNGSIFVATNTSNNVAVLRTLPEIVMSAFFFFFFFFFFFKKKKKKKKKQDRIGMHWGTRLSWEPKERKLQMG